MRRVKDCAEERLSSGGYRNILVLKKYIAISFFLFVCLFYFSRKGPVALPKSRDEKFNTSRVCIHFYLHYLEIMNNVFSGK